MDQVKAGPIGHQYALALIEGGETQLRTLAKNLGDQTMLDAFLRVQTEEPVPAFLHSALCAMSLPTKRPKDETARFFAKTANTLWLSVPGPLFRPWMERQS